MNATFGFQVNRVRGFNGVEVAKMANNAVDVDLRSPFGQRLVPSDPKFAGSSQAFCAALVLHVDTAGYVSKVTDSIVASNAVDVVDLAYRPLTEHVKPHEAVLRESVAVDPYSSVSVEFEMSGRLSAERAKMLRKLANEDSRLSVVIEHGSKAIMGKELLHKTNSTRAGGAYA